MSKGFMVTEIKITRGYRKQNDDGAWEWLDKENLLMKRGMVMQRGDNMDKSFLDALHKMIADIMGKLFDDWSYNQQIKQPAFKPKIIVAGIKDALPEGEK